MRILHFADLHLGVETYGRTDPASGLSTRLLDFLRALDELVEFAIEEQVDLVLFCGDAYKSREPSQTQQREFALRLRRMVDAGMPVFLLVGNHDLPGGIGRATTLEIFDTLGIERVYVAATPKTVVVPTRGGPVQIVALPWLTPSRLLAREESKNMSVDQLMRAMEERISEFVEEQAAGLDASLPAILAAHVAMSGSLVQTGSEQWMTVGRYPQLMKSSLRPDAFDYVALGHHHVKQVVSHAPPIVYPGSLQRVDFGEEKDEKGFYTVALDPSRPRGQRAVGEPQFHAVWARPFVTVEVRPRQEDPTREVVAAIERAAVSDAIVRVIVRVSRQQQALLRQAEVRQALAGAHFLAYIKAELTDEPRSGRLPEHVRAESLRPMEALRLYLEERKVPPERREMLLRYARALVAGEEAEVAAAAGGE
ncbi:MAG: metallophosphoesterase family protein [Dehalococcoidia bacterium]